MPSGGFQDSPEAPVFRSKGPGTMAVFVPFPLKKCPPQNLLQNWYLDPQITSSTTPTLLLLIQLRLCPPFPLDFEGPSTLQTPSHLEPFPFNSFPRPTTPSLLRKGFTRKSAIYLRFFSHVPFFFSPLPLVYSSPEYRKLVLLRFFPCVGLTPLELKTRGELGSPFGQEPLGLAGASPSPLFFLSLFP